MHATLLMLLLVAAPPEQWRPIDQAVGDLDTLSTSLRQWHAGLRLDGEHTSLFQDVDDDGQSHLYRVGPGFRARVDHVDYLVRRGKKQLIRNAQPRRDGEFLELPGGQTVYELTPLPMVTAPPPHSGAIDARVDRRVDGRVGAAPERSPTVHLAGQRRLRAAAPPPAPAGDP